MDATSAHLDQIDSRVNDMTTDLLEPGLNVIPPTTESVPYFVDCLLSNSDPPIVMWICQISLSRTCSEVRA